MAKCNESRVMATLAAAASCVAISGLGSAAGIGASLAFALTFATPAVAEAVRIDWIDRKMPQPPILSNMQATPDTLGLDGAQLGLSDIATTGRFLGHDYTLVDHVIAEDAPWQPVVEAALADGARLLVIDAPAEVVPELADMAAAQGALVFSTSAPDERLREADCRANLLHTAPSRRMKSDALAQFLMSKRWDDLAMISGTHPQDRAWAEAITASLAKFGLRIAAEKTWAFDANMRRAAAAEVPLFTQDLPDHDVLLVADELGDFARYIAYNTWLPRPLAGSEGVRPVGWSGVVEQNGAAQLQNRFRETTGREMQADDFAAWAAIAAIGEAVTRTGSADPQALRSYLLSDGFRLGGFLGHPLSFRPWNGQLRQPIPLVTERAVVALAPIEGFLHQVNELDTLGADQPETNCSTF